MSILKLKDSQGNWISVPTLKGDKGNGIQSAVLNNDYTLTLTFTDGTTYTTPSIRGEKGEQGEPATDMDIHICSASEYDSETRIPTITSPDDKTFYLVPTEDGTSPDLFTEWVYVNNTWEMFGSMKIDLSGYLTDVTVDGTSVVSDGVAEIPIADNNDAGTVKINSLYGVSILTDGTLQTAEANSAMIKRGSAAYKPIAPRRQHESTFYGLAKSAGDSTQSVSDNAVGTYTNEAKSSIQNMLGITDKYSPKEWVAESETELVTNAHNIGDLFYIGETLYKVIADLNAGDAVNVGINVEEVNANDILDDYATKQEIENNINIVEKNSNGSIASFNDGADNIPLKSLVVDIDPVQDLHGYNSPWVGGGGKNKFDKSAVTISDLSPVYSLTDGSVYDSAKSGFDYHLPNGTYTIKFTACDTGCTYVNAHVLNSDNSLVDSAFRLTTTTSATTLAKTFTISDGQFLRVYRGTTNALDISGVNIQIEEGSTATDWTPYENICPISGWTGANITATNTNLRGGIDLANDIKARIPSATIDTEEKTVSWGYNATHNAVYAPKVPFKENTRYTFIITVQNASKRLNFRIYYTDGSVQALPDLTTTGKETLAIVTSANKTVLTIVRQAQGGTTKIYYDESGVFEGVLTASDFQQFGRTIFISWQSEAGTVYGGSLDVLSGVLRVEYYYCTLDNATRINYGIDSQSNLPYAYIGLPKTGASTGLKDRTLCSMYKAGSVQKVDKALRMWTSEADIWDSDMDVTSLDTVKAYLADLVIVYPLATPIEIQLTPNQVNSLLGANNIWADTGDTEVEYFSQVDEDLVDYIKANLNSYAKKDLLNNYIDDIQINGISIVENGTAEIPFATSNAGGIVKIDSSLGIKINDTNKLLINRATTTQTKAGSDAARPIVPVCQHESVFYGLTKAAGVDMASSSNAVGTYTESAKSAISDMLNGAIQISGTDPTIIAKSGIRYVCGEVLSLNFTPSVNGICDVMFTSGSTPTVLTLPNTVKMPEWFIIEANTTYEINIADGIYGAVTSWTV